MRPCSQRPCRLKEGEATAPSPHLPPQRLSMKLPNTLVIATALVSSLIACSQQGQGERCLTANGNADCEAGLVCTPKDELSGSERNETYAADRCCPPIDGPQWSDPRCEPGTRAAPAAGGSGNSTGAGGSAGNGNSSTSGGVAGNPDSAQAGAATSPSEAGGNASTDPSASTAATAGSGA